MPEERLTGKRIADHLRRCGVIYIAGIVVLVFLNNLVYTMTRPRIPEEETVRVMVVNQNADFSRQSEQWLESVRAADETVRALEFESIWYDSARYETGVAMPVKLMAGGYDLLIADPSGFEEMVLMGALLPLEGYLEGDELPGIERVSVRNTETGEEFIGALRMDFLGLEDVYVGMAVNSDNPESAWTASRVLRDMEGESV